MELDERGVEIVILIHSRQEGAIHLVSFLRSREIFTGKRQRYEITHQRK